MRRVRALLAAFITICGLLLGSIDVTAAGVQGMEILTDDTAVRKGQEITLTFALKGYEEIREGVNAFKGTLEFDSDVFEKADGEDFAALNSWERLYYNPDNGQFVLINRAGSMEDEAVFSLRLKAKESIPAKEALITVKKICIRQTVSLRSIRLQWKHREKRKQKRRNWNLVLSAQEIRGLGM